MECNREEALKAREIAVKKLENRDFEGAKRIALKAQRIFPDIENIPQLLTVCEVLCAAEAKVNGMMDCYGILQVEGTADEMTIKRQYRKLVLSLHPDKNSYAGAESAFKLVAEAYSTLADRAKRYAYDVKWRNATKYAPKQATQPTQTAEPSRATQPNQATQTKQAAKPKQAGARKHVAKPNLAEEAERAAQPKQGKQPMKTTEPINKNGAKGSNTAGYRPSGSAATDGWAFWTICIHCKTKYKYYGDILNREIRCQNCRKNFFAHQISTEDVPSVFSSKKEHSAKPGGEGMVDHTETSQKGVEFSAPNGNDGAEGRMQSETTVPHFGVGEKLNSGADTSLASRRRK